MNSLAASAITDRFFSGIEIPGFMNRVILRENTTVALQNMGDQKVPGPATFNDYFINTVIPHKIAVFEAGIELAGIDWFEHFAGILRGQWVEQLIMHDLTKFSTVEAAGYVGYNFKDKSANTPKAKANFERAWLHHKNHNEHHPEYWISTNRNGGEVEALEMPPRYIAEMVADWIGAGRTYGSSLEDWLPKNLQTFLFHSETLKNLAFLLDKLGFKTELDYSNHLTVI